MKLKYQQYYQTLHKQGYLSNAEESNITDKECNAIKAVVLETESKTILDFGCGNLSQYEVFEIHKKFNIERENVFYYDPGIEKYSQIPKGTFDGVVCSDVLEHVPEDELDETLELLFSKADKFAFIAVYCGLSQTILPNGENAHCTLKKPREWESLIKSHNKKNIKLIIYYRIPLDPKLRIT